MTPSQIRALAVGLEMAEKWIKIGIALLVLGMALWLAASVAVAFMPGGPGYTYIHSFGGVK